MSQNTVVIASKYFFNDTVWGVLKFPVWWYTRGLKIMLVWFGNSLSAGLQYTAVYIWVKNIFVPMYGDVTVVGRLISFAMRLIMIVFRGFGYVVWVILTLLIFLAYLVILPISILGIIYHAAGVVIF